MIVAMIFEISPSKYPGIDYFYPSFGPGRGHENGVEREISGIKIEALQQIYVLANSDFVSTCTRL